MDYMDSPLPGLNDLVREAFDAQEEFDNYDSDSSDEKQAEMGRLSRAWDAANLKLVDYVITHSDKLRRALEEEESES